MKKQLIKEITNINKLIKNEQKIKSELILKITPLEQEINLIEEKFKLEINDKNIYENIPKITKIKKLYETSIRKNRERIFIQYNLNNYKKENETKEKNLQKTNSNNNIKYNNIINQNNNISIENNVLKKEITFLSKKHNLTPKKKEKRRKNGESKKRNGNAINKITNSCIYNMHYFIKKLYKNINVDKPTTSNIEKKSYEEKGKLLNKTIYELYCENIMTKRFKGDKDIIDVDKNKQKIKN